MMSDRGRADRYESYSASEFARYIGDELERYYAVFGTRDERLFYFAGQDPFHRGLPADAIGELYWSLSSAARTTMTEGLNILLTSRVEGYRLESIRQVIWAVGLLQREDLLVRMVRSIGGRRDDPRELRPLVVAASQVIRGFPHTSSSLQAAGELVGLEHFSSSADLIYDMLDFMIGNPDRLWSDVVVELEESLKAVCKPSRENDVMNRLSFTAIEVAKHISIDRVAEGLNRLIDVRGPDEVIAHVFNQMWDPLGMLIAALVLNEDAPFRVDGGEGVPVHLAGAHTKKRSLIRTGDTLFRLRPAAVAAARVPEWALAA